MAVKRDALSWWVDVSTIAVGIVAVGALILSAVAVRSEGNRSSEGWMRQIALDHHARVYDAAARLIQHTGRWASLAIQRVQARGAASIDYGYGSGADESVDDESVDPQYAQLLDTLGTTRSAIADALAEAVYSLDLLYLLISRDGDGQKLLADLILLRQAFDCVRPTTGSEVGNGDLVATIHGSGLQHDVEMLISLEHLGPDRPVERIRCVEALVSMYFRGRIGRFVPPPPLSAIGGA